MTQIEIKQFNVGDLVELSAEFTDKDGEPVAPTSVTFKYKPPAGSIVTLSSPTTSTLGTYYVEIPVTVEGRWRWRAESTNGGQPFKASEHDFDVLRSAFD